ncbi:uncharacterized protein CIMG_13430 [Coccidioides immitis RS]|uniref:Uncharacterized protein n=1 Tax=Coccidioides immitis (strain RS) TaxID=246410 RepID=A0A0D8JUZ4_COCIM|nr:uncharacterized protein CIMG_13430 [Coccidioides immitis RS]KJF61112.1 hypothetical protein CIMG_13430 [Coccidioides immitis RS]
MLIRSNRFETDPSQLSFEFTSTLANPSSQSEAPKHYSERITAISAHQILQDLDNNNKFIISSESNEEISQHKCKESVMAVHSASKLRLQTYILNRKELLNHLAHIHRNYYNISSVKINNNIYLWFHLANRPARAEDALSIYKFKH